MALTAAPLQPGVFQFTDGNGVPLAGGFVYTFVPGGSTPKRRSGPRRSRHGVSRPPEPSGAGRRSLRITYSGSP